MEHANWHHLSVVARLKPGVTPEDAQRDLAALVPELPKEFPNAYSESFLTNTKFAPRVQTFQASIIGSFDKILWVVLGAVGVVLLIAVVNVANLFLVRSEARRNEVAVRTALGAERAHLALQSLCESMVLTLTAGALGIWLAAAGLKVLVRLAPGTIPRLDQVHLRGSSILFDVAVALTVGLVFASFPLLRRRIQFEPLRESGRGLTTSRAQLRVRSVLVTAQIALALVLLSAAGLMLRSFQQTLHVQSGIDATNVLALDVSMPFSRYNKFDKAALFWQQLEQRAVGAPRRSKLERGDHRSVLELQPWLRHDDDGSSAQVMAAALPGVFPIASLRPAISRRWASKCRAAHWSGLICRRTRAQSWSANRWRSACGQTRIRSARASAVTTRAMCIFAWSA